MSERVVFDTNTVVSALLFKRGFLTWLPKHWQSHCTPLASRETAFELTRVLAYPKFKLSQQDREELLGDYLPYCTFVEVVHGCAIPCRDKKDQPFLDLAESGSARSLVSGDEDLLTLNGQTSFSIESPSSFASRTGAP